MGSRRRAACHSPTLSMWCVKHHRGGPQTPTVVVRKSGTLPRVKFVDQLRAGAKDLGSVPKWVGRSAGNAGRTVGRTVSGLPSRATDLVRRDGSGATATPRTTSGGDGLVERARDNPRYAIAIAGGGLLLIAWIAWAIYVTTDHGARAGLGVLLSWPVLLGLLALVSLPFIGLYLLIRRRNEGGTATADDEHFEDEAMDADDEEEEDEVGEEEDADDEDSEEEEEPDEDDEDEDDDEEPASKAK